MADVSDSTTRTNLGTAMSCATDAATIVATLSTRLTAHQFDATAGDFTGVAVGVRFYIAEIERMNAALITLAASLIEGYPTQLAS